MWSSLLAAVVAVSLCPAAAPPVDGPIVATFAPVGRYSGHWGVDYAAPVGTHVNAVADGTVTFAGAVAGRLSVSIDHGRGLMSTVSYLSERVASRGDRVGRGDRLGLAGAPHDVAGVHLSLRVDGEYVDPAALFGCRQGDVSDALRLVPLPG